jgi:hypothetical protein
MNMKREKESDKGLLRAMFCMPDESWTGPDRMKGAKTAKAGGWTEARAPRIQYHFPRWSMMERRPKRGFDNKQAIKA